MRGKSVNKVLHCSFIYHMELVQCSDEIARDERCLVRFTGLDTVHAAHARGSLGKHERRGKEALSLFADICLK